MRIRSEVIADDHSFDYLYEQYLKYKTYFGGCKTPKHSTKELFYKIFNVDKECAFGEFIDSYNSFSIKEKDNIIDLIKGKLNG